MLVCKLQYYTKRGDYSYPRQYYFVAPQGAGTKLSNLLRDSNALRTGLISAWAEYCQNKITETAAVCLNQSLKKYINSVDLSIFKAIPPLRLIEGHAKTKWHIFRFGGVLPHRPPAAVPPSAPSTAEANYIRALLRAYSDHLKRDLKTIQDLLPETNLLEHLSDSRIEFYSAESLRSFSRDTLPPGEFEKLQDEIYSGIKDDLRDNHPDGYRRVVAVVKTARCLQLTSHILNNQVSIRDRGGICHQLANDKKVRWVK